MGVGGGRGGGGVVRCRGSGVVVVGCGGRCGGRGFGWWRIGGEGDRSADEVLELPARDAELLAEADGREVAVAVVGGAAGELVRRCAADAAHGGRLLDGEKLLPGVAHDGSLRFDTGVDADGQRTIAVRRRSGATGSTRITTSPS